MRTSVNLAIGVLAACLAAFPLPAQSIPPVTDLVAIMQDPPRSGRGLPGVEQGDAVRFVRAVYKIRKPSCYATVYASRDKRAFKWGPSNVAVSVEVGPWATAPLEYRVVDGHPRYVLQRSDGLWFLFDFPDEPIDVATFLKRFGAAYAFFERNQAGARIEDCLPSLVGSY